MTGQDGRDIIEVLTPAQDDPDFEAKLTTFGDRYRRTLGHDAVVSIPDNPMGRLRFTAMEVLDELGLPVDPDRLLVHINTFHPKPDLDALLEAAAGRGVRYLLVVSGDGGPRLSRVEPSELGTSARTVTSVELLAYIHSRFPGTFTCGVAFNQYEPWEHEIGKLDRKLAAGARFVVTQPVIGTDARVARLMDRDLPLFVGAWMSRKVDLVYQCVGIERPTGSGDPPYSPEDNLRLLRSAYPSAGVYLSMVSWKGPWAGLSRGAETSRSTVGPISRP